ncbi:hypothetical protein C4577_02015 [Candidatus Parcubacteria bacterium]|nr:MAG: hypothetical protein C4577_02015 [Candidatus Parcubacteria bacterium]
MSDAKYILCVLGKDEELSLEQATKYVADSLNKQYQSSLWSGLFTPTEFEYIDKKMTIIGDSWFSEERKWCRYNFLLKGIETDTDCNGDSLPNRLMYWLGESKLIEKPK